MTLQKVSLNAHGMWCNNCALAVSRLLKKQTGVIEADVSFAGSLAIIQWEDTLNTLPEILKVAEKLGYGFSEYWDRETQDHILKTEIHQISLRLAVAVFCSMWIMMLAIARYIDTTSIPPAVDYLLAWIEGGLSLPILFFAATPFFKAGWRGVRAGHSNMDLLISLGILSATGLSLWHLAHHQSEVYFDSVAMLALFLLFGRLLEHKSRHEGKSAVESLLEQSPERVTLQNKKEEWVEKDLKQVKRGAKIRVLPGEIIPLDGHILQGESELDCSILTGESLPVEVSIGSLVFAGSINGRSPLIIEASCTEGQRKIDLLLQEVRYTLASKMPSWPIIERFTRYFIPLILLLSTLTLGMSWLLGNSLEESILRAIAVLIISCPCAIGMAVPMAITVAIKYASESGFLIREGDLFEHIPEIRHIIYDKTGTLTTGEFQIVDILTEPGISAHNCLYWCAQAEQGSEHPLAKAILKANTHPLISLEKGKHKSYPGQGVYWECCDQRMEIHIGTSQFLKAQNIQGVSLVSQSNAHTLIYIAVNRIYQGCIALSDTLRPGIQEAIQSLTAQGYTQTILSGDGETIVAQIAQQVGITDFRAQCQPEDKAQRIRALQAENHQVLYIGDGINDSVAIAQANTGIAVASASDVARRAATVLFFHGGAEQLPELLSLSYRTHHILKQNIAWAMGYNLLAIPVAMSGWIRPQYGVMLMVLSSLSVTFNALRIRRTSKQFSKPSKK